MAIDVNEYYSVHLCPNGATVPRVHQVRGGAHVQHGVTCINNQYSVPFSTELKLESYILYYIEMTMFL